MNVLDPVVFLGATLTAAGLAVKLLHSAAPETHIPLILLSRAQIAVHAVSQSTPHTPSPPPVHIPPSITPLRLHRSQSALSLDASRCPSSLRLETDRINRMSCHFQALERKAQCEELRSIRLTQRQGFLEEEKRRWKEVHDAEIAFQRRKLEENKRISEREKSDKMNKLKEYANEKKRQKIREKAVLKDELRRSELKLSLSKYGKQRKEEEKRRDRLEKAQDWKEFMAAKRKIDSQEREKYEEALKKDLAFQLNQAVCRNQAVVEGIAKAGYLQV